MTDRNVMPMIGDRPMYWKLLPDHSFAPATRGEFAEEFENPALRAVAYDKVGEVEVSTVFLAMDHNFGGGPPLLFETMIFGPDGNGESQWRYTTWDEAVAGHARVLEAVRAGRDPDDG